MFKYELKIEQSNRKTISISVDIEGVIYVKAPKYLRETEIKDYILTKQNWINNTLEKVSKEKNRRDKYLIKYGNKILFKGRDYVIKKNENFEFTRIDGNNILSAVKNESKLELNIIEFLKNEAIKYVKENVEKYSILMSLNYKEAKISNARKRWGSCSNSGNININWRLVMAPEEVIDSVIIHELSHLKYFNHSRGFQEMIRKYDPKHKKHDKWLQSHAYILSLY